MNDMSGRVEEELPPSKLGTKQHWDDVYEYVYQDPLTCGLRRALSVEGAMSVLLSCQSGTGCAPLGQLVKR